MKSIKKFREEQDTNTYTHNTKKKDKMKTLMRKNVRMSKVQLMDSDTHEDNSTYTYN